MVEEDKNTRSLARELAFKAVKALLKSFVFYMLYLFVWSFFAQFESYVPGLRQTAENFVVVYLSLGVFGDIFSDTVFQCLFNVARALFVMGYLILSVKNGVFNLTYMGVALTVDLRFFLMAAVLLSLLGLAKAMLQAINYVNEKAELPFNL
ncbi:MAG: hypothetical protein NZ932_02725 [Candidatus Bathyarchaeota archaeon]|nr:hypothetical protein [Candidatus Bathyarchaeota archaeon]MDW8041145.1 hypothetical protein [Nitrososphaerota archaeon]